MADETPVYLEEYTRLHPADLADELQRMEVPEARRILQELPNEQSADALAELERDVVLKLLEQFPRNQLIPI